MLEISGRDGNKYEGKKFTKVHAVNDMSYESIERGKDLFHTKCRFCHNAYNTETTVGPGLKGVLGRPRLPVSRRKASQENIIMQLKHPIDRMPSFAYLSDKEIDDLLAFLKTL